jgi:hypothetical protein
VPPLGETALPREIALLALSWTVPRTLLLWLSPLLLLLRPLRLPVLLSSLEVLQAELLQMMVSSQPHRPCELRNLRSS